MGNVDERKAEVKGDGLKTDGLRVDFTHFQKEAKLSIEQVFEWKDRLEKGMEPLGIASLIWVAYAYGFPSYDFSVIEARSNSFSQ